MNCKSNKYLMSTKFENFNEIKINNRTSACVWMVISRVYIPENNVPDTIIAFDGFWILIGAIVTEIQNCCTTNRILLQFEGPPSLNWHRVFCQVLSAFLIKGTHAHIHSSLTHCHMRLCKRCHRRTYAMWIKHTDTHTTRMSRAHILASNYVFAFIYAHTHLPHILSTNRRRSRSRKKKQKNNIAYKTYCNMPFQAFHTY